MDVSLAHGRRGRSQIESLLQLTLPAQILWNCSGVNGNEMFGETACTTAFFVQVTPLQVSFPQTQKIKAGFRLVTDTCHRSTCTWLIGSSHIRRFGTKLPLAPGLSLQCHLGLHAAYVAEVHPEANLPERVRNLVRMPLSHD